MKNFIHKIPKKYKILVTILIPLLIAFAFITKSTANIGNTAKVERQAFTSEVIGEGEINALKFQTINAPDLMRNHSLRIWNVRLLDLVQEGTKVKKGDFIAKLDPSDVEDRLKNTMEQVEEYKNSLENAKLDSTITLTEQRDKITNNIDAVQERKIKLEQSKYESKAAQRQAAIALQKAELALKTSERNYQKEIQRQKNKVERLESSLKDATEKSNQYSLLKKQFIVKSPSAGLVVYARLWGGRKLKINDFISPWNPEIATIPDLTSLVSEAIVKEIDIAKIKIGQKVKLSIDAFPDKEFNGEVIKIANIGQPISGAGMNGFKVMIKIQDSNNKILPGMTTYNKITVLSFPDELTLPREAIFGNDSLQFVYLKKGGSLIQKTIQLEGENETHVRIISGLNEGDIVSLSQPQ